MMKMKIEEKPAADVKLKERATACGLKIVPAGDGFVVVNQIRHSLEPLSFKSFKTVNGKKELKIMMTLEEVGKLVKSFEIWTPLSAM